jgi:hypothetical protein
MSGEQHIFIIVIGFYCAPCTLIRLRTIRYKTLIPGGQPYCYTCLGATNISEIIRLASFGLFGNAYSIALGQKVIPYTPVLATIQCIFVFLILHQNSKKSKPLKQPRLMQRSMWTLSASTRIRRRIDGDSWAKYLFTVDFLANPLKFCAVNSSNIPGYWLFSFLSNSCRVICRIQNVGLMTPSSNAQCTDNFT